MGRPARSLQGPPSLIQAASSSLALARSPVSLTVGPASIALVQLCFRQSFSGVPIDPGPDEVPYAISARGTRTRIARVGLGHALVGVEPRRPLVSTSAKLRQVLTIRGESWMPKLLR
jgi:hypothetical protein